jgi:predicted nucleic acid-binding protein
MIILDTSIWIEFLKTHEPYFTTIFQLLEQKNILAVECVFGELLQGVKNDTEQNILLNYWNHLPKIETAEIIIDLFKNRKDAIIKEWEGEKRQGMPKRFFLNGCTG